MTKTKEQLIQDYKKSNKLRRQKIAENNGFKTGEQYLDSLQNNYNKKPQKMVKKIVGASKMKGIFHIIDVLDATGSMKGGKYENSKRGIIDGIQDMKERKDVKYSLIEFIDSSHDMNHAISIASLKDVNTDRIKFSGANGWNTPLYKTIYDVISTTSVKKEDKVLINVYTDGGNNTAYEYTSKCASLIKKVQKENFTITFVATPEDLERIMHDISIDKSNTLATDNTAEGFEKSMLNTRKSRTSYFSTAASGADVLTGFYKEATTL